LKIILIPLIGLMIPVAFIVVAYEIAKAWVEYQVEKTIKEKI
jgi:hypothetical protein